MPEKEGAEEKTTKSVVNKKQKQMMGEEGYDIARDMGRVRPSKDKKDATTMPPSKEMEKTRKVNKGPSALELVKKKYKGQIMDVKKEELDLTQVAEAFGGYIIEAPVDSEGNIKPKTGDAGKERRLINKEIKKITQPKPGDIKKEKQTLQKFIKSTDAAAAKNKAAGDKLLQDINKRKSADLTRADAINRAMGTSGSTEGAGGAGGSSSSKSGSKRDKIDITGTGGRNRPPVTGGKDRPTDDSKLVQQTLPGLETTTTTTTSRRTRRQRTQAEKDVSNKKRQQTRVQNKRKAQEKGGQQTIDFDQFVDKAKKQVQDIKKQPVGQTVKQVFTRTFLTPEKGVRGLVGKVTSNPVGTAIAAGIARDSVRNPLPQLQMPTVKGGKVGKRTAG